MQGSQLSLIASAHSLPASAFSGRMLRLADPLPALERGISSAVLEKDQGAVGSESRVDDCTGRTSVMKTAATGSVMPSQG